MDPDEPKTTLREQALSARRMVSALEYLIAVARTSELLRVASKLESVRADLLRHASRARREPKRSKARNTSIT